MTNLLLSLTILSSSLFLGNSSTPSSAMEEERFEEYNVYVTSVSSNSSGGQCATISICDGPLETLYDQTAKLRANTYYLVQIARESPDRYNCYASYTLIKSAYRSSCN